MLLLEGGSEECKQLVGADHKDDHLLVAGDKGMCIYMAFVV